MCLIKCARYSMITNIRYAKASEAYGQEKFNWRYVYKDNAEASKREISS